jgi:hypothetical protein
MNHICVTFPEVDPVHRNVEVFARLAELTTRAECSHSRLFVCRDHAANSTR